MTTTRKTTAPEEAGMTTIDATMTIDERTKNLPPRVDTTMKTTDEILPRSVTMMKTTDEILPRSVTMMKTMTTEETVTDLLVTTKTTKEIDTMTEMTIADLRPRADTTTTMTRKTTDVSPPRWVATKTRTTAKATDAPRSDPTTK